MLPAVVIGIATLMMMAVIVSTRWNVAVHRPIRVVIDPRLSTVLGYDRDTEVDGNMHLGGLGARGKGHPKPNGSGGGDC